MHVKFSGKGNLVQKENDAISGGPVINIYIVYKITLKTVTSDSVFKNSLFGRIKVSNTQESDKKVEIFWIWFDIWFNKYF